MKIIKKQLTNSQIKNKSFNLYFEGYNMAVFDIETTGLSPAYSRLILSGIITIIDGQRTAYEILAESLDDEKNVILKTIELLSQCDFVLTFNGKHFDIPFLKTRAEKYNIDIPLMYNLDIYLILNSSKEFKENLPNLKQKSVEEFLGIGSKRKDTISGKESVELFSHYLDTGDKIAEEKILLHNYDDICQLYRLLPVIKFIDFHKAMTKRGFPSTKSVVEKIQFKVKELIVKGYHTINKDYISFPSDDFPCNINFSKNGTFDIVIPFEKEKGISFVDADKLLGNFSSQISKYPGYQFGYIVLKEGESINHIEVNLFIMLLLKKIIQIIG